MSGNEGGAPRRPLLRLDHVLLPVLDLAAAAQEMQSRHGLRALAGGRHPGVGTANMIIPLGSTYIELIAVVDEAEAARFPRSRRVLEAAQAGRPFVTWAARTDDLDGFRAALLAAGWDLPDITQGARDRPDGVHLKWRTQELVEDARPSVLPFVIEWDVPADAHPAAAAAEHSSGAGDIVATRFTAPDPQAAARQLRAFFDGGLEFEVEPGEVEALVAIELRGPAARIRIP